MPKPSGIIVLIGVSGCGKSTVGRLLAPSLSASFVEGDEYHPASNIAKMRRGMPLGDADRWPWLVRLGRALRARASNGRRVVVTCSALRRRYREALRRSAAMPLLFVHLDIDTRVVRKRMESRRGHFMPASLLTSQVAALEPLDPREGGLRIADATSAHKLAAMIRRHVASRACFVGLPEYRR